MKKPIENARMLFRSFWILPLICLLPAALPGTTLPLDEWHWRKPLPQGNDLYAMTYANGRFVAVGDYGTILNSADGVVWSAHSLEPSRALLPGDLTVRTIGH